MSSMVFVDGPRLAYLPLPTGHRGTISESIDVDDAELKRTADSEKIDGDNVLYLSQKLILTSSPSPEAERCI